MTAKGEIQKFKDFPELLPVFPRKAVLAIKRELEKNPNFGFETIRCLKFGGQCHSGNPRCKAMRAQPDFLKLGKILANGKTLQQYDENAEDESLTGNTGGRADNLLTLAEFRSETDAQAVAHALNVMKQIANGKEDRVTQ